MKRNNHSSLLKSYYNVNIYVFKAVFDFFNIYKYIYIYCRNAYIFQMATYNRMQVHDSFKCWKEDNMYHDGMTRERYNMFDAVEGIVVCFYRYHVVCPSHAGLKVYSKAQGIGYAEVFYFFFIIKH